MKENDEDQLRSTELWVTAATGVINTMLVSATPTHTSITLVICLTVTAITYLICRTLFKITKIKHAPNSIVEFKAQVDGKRKEPIMIQE